MYLSEELAKTLHISLNMANEIVCANSCSEREELQRITICRLMEILQAKESEMAQKLRAKDEDIDQLKNEQIQNINGLTQMYQAQIEWKNKTIEQLQAENNDLKCLATEAKVMGNPLKQLAKATEKVAVKVSDRLKEVKEKIDTSSPVIIEGMNVQFVAKQEMNFNKEVGQQIAFAANVGAETNH